MKLTKTLGPTSSDLLLRLSSGGKAMFSVQDALAVTGTSYKATNRVLSDMVKRRWLMRLGPGKYLIVPLEAGLESIPMADRYVIAREVLGTSPYYVSHYSAMELHQMTTQPVNTVYVAVPRQRDGRTIAGVEYRFVYANARAFWGWETMWATDQEQVLVSDLEKTLLDCAVRPQLCGGIGEMAKGLWSQKEKVDEDRLVAYAERLGHKAAAKRLGFLLETYDLARPATLAALGVLANASYDLLDPTMPDQGAYRARWRLRINLDPEELEATFWT